MGIINMVDKPAVEQETDSRYIDLNINQIADAVSNNWGSDVSRFYAIFPDDAEAEKYRRDIYMEIESTGLYEGLCDAQALSVRVAQMAAERAKYVEKLQKTLSHVHEVRLYCEAADELRAMLADKSFTSKGLNWLQSSIEKYTSDTKYVAMRDEANELCAAIDRLKLTFVYENDRLQVSVSEEECDAAGISVDTPFHDYRDPDGLEFALYVQLTDKRPKLFRELKSFYGDYENYQEEWLMQFYDEVTFYLSYMRFERYMGDNGFTLTMAKVSENEPMKAEGLYDLALAVANIKRKRPVVSNEFIYDNDEQFFVLTGPNQGGKTTFARSLGQLVYLTKLGLKVPAQSANVHYFDDLLTHFSVEESIETGRGKLMEELVRLKPMMNMSGKNFVVINELFTTAANYDACIMGRRVLQHFIANGCCGIYVTHLSELLEGTDHATGLCAQLDEQGVQTFKILRRVMEYNNVAAAQMRKYRLSYEELAKRLKKDGNSEEEKA